MIYASSCLERNKVRHSRLYIYIRPLSSVRIRVHFAWTFRDLWVGGVLVKTCINALCRFNFLKRKTNPLRYQIQHERGIGLYTELKHEKITQ